MFVRDVDLGVFVLRQQAFGSGRRLSAVAWRSAASVRGSGEQRQGAATTDVALTQGRRRKEKTFRELTRPGARARLVVLALGVGGRWSAEAKSFVGLLARSKPRVLQCRMEQAIEVVQHAAARLFAMSLLGFRMRWSVTTISRGWTEIDSFVGHFC